MDEHPNPAQWWTHRRAMAYAALGGILVLLGGTLAGRVTAELVPLAQTLAWVLVTIIGLYFGGNAVVEGLSKVRR